MIKVEQLHFAYGTRAVFNGIDLAIQEGEILSLLGPNGCGKSTFLKLLRGILRPAAGTVELEGQSVTSFSRKAMARKMAVVAQSCETYFAYTVRELVAMGRFPYRSLLADLTVADRCLVEKVMQTTDIAHLADRLATDLSGGELQRVMLARALAQETPVLLLDEATSHLDLIHRLSITDRLVHLNRDRGTTIIQVSHDLELAAEISHRVLLFDTEGRVAALGSPAEVFTPETIKQVYGVDVEIDTGRRSGALRIYPVRPSLVGVVD